MLSVLGTYQGCRSSNGLHYKLENLENLKNGERKIIAKMKAKK